MQPDTAGPLHQPSAASLSGQGATRGDATWTTSDETVLVRYRKLLREAPAGAVGIRIGPYTYTLDATENYLDQLESRKKEAEAAAAHARAVAASKPVELDLEKGVSLSIAAWLYNVYGDIGWGPAEEIHHARGMALAAARLYRGFAPEKLSEIGGHSGDRRCIEEKLAAGKLRGTGLLRGRLPPDPPRVSIPADYWPRLTLDYASSSAVGADFELTDILIFPVWPSPGETDTPSPLPPAVPRRAAAETSSLPNRPPNVEEIAAILDATFPETMPGTAKAEQLLRPLIRAQFGRPANSGLLRDVLARPEYQARRRSHGRPPKIK